MRHLCSLFLLLLLPAFAIAQNPEWTTAIKPYRVGDNLYYVGSRDLAAYLITTPAGNILINANLESSPPQIKESVVQLGFRWEDIKIVLNSQAHRDHVGGLAEVLRQTHAKNMVMDADANVVATGGHTDFAFGPGPLFPKAHVDKILHDGAVVKLGGIILVAHKTAGHTRGCTTWTMQTHMDNEPAGKKSNVVIVGGLLALPEYRVVATPGHPVSYPGIKQDFLNLFPKMRQLPCDVFLGAHGSYFNMLEKLERLPRDGAKVWMDNAGYQQFINEAEHSFKEMLAAQETHK